MQDYNFRAERNLWEHLIQGFSQCTLSSPGLGLASAELAARHVNRRGKLWKGLLFAFTPSTHRKEKLKQNKEIKNNNVLVVSLPARRQPRRSWISLADGQLAHHHSEVRLWEVKILPTPFPHSQILGRARLSMARRHQGLQCSPFQRNFID